MNRIRLPPPDGSSCSRRSKSVSSSLRVLEALKRIAQISVDTLVSLAFAFFLIAIFVAESTGAVLSANIFSDTFALSSSPECVNLLPNPPTVSTFRLVSSYQKTCYDALSIDTRCNVYANRTIAYTKRFDAPCPFRDGVCLQPAHTLDTGYVNAKAIGLNTAKDYFVRRTTSCAPIRSVDNAAFFTFDENSVDRDMSNALPLQFAGCNFTKWARSRNSISSQVFTRESALPDTEKWVWADIPIRFSVYTTNSHLKCTRGRLLIRYRARLLSKRLQSI